MHTFMYVCMFVWQIRRVSCALQARDRAHVWWHGSYTHTYVYRYKRDDCPRTSGAVASRVSGLGKVLTMTVAAVMLLFAAA